MFAARHLQLAVLEILDELAKGLHLRGVAPHALELSALGRGDAGQTDAGEPLPERFLRAEVHVVVAVARAAKVSIHHDVLGRGRAGRGARRRRRVERERAREVRSSQRRGC